MLSLRSGRSAHASARRPSIVLSGVALGFFGGRSKHTSGIEIQAACDRMAKRGLMLALDSTGNPAANRRLNSDLHPHMLHRNDAPAPSTTTTASPCVKPVNPLLPVATQRASSPSFPLLSGTRCVPRVLSSPLRRPC